MNIGEQLKKLREHNDLTRKEAADKLREIGIEISDKTLYGYESGRNTPNADMFLALCKIYKCNNVMKTFSDSVDDVLFTNSEWEIITKYRDLDPHGKEMVDIVLTKEHERCENAAKSHENAAKNAAPDKVSEFPTIYNAAANERTDIDVTEDMRKHDDDIMMDDSEWE